MHADALDRLPRPRVGRVEAEVPELLQREVRRRPRVEERAALVGPPRPVRAAVPAAVGILQREQLGAPSLRRDARPLALDVAGRGIGEIAQDLLADRGVGLQKPRGDVHGPSVGAVTDTTA